MRFVVNVKPIVVKATTKQELLGKIAGMGLNWTSNNKGTCYMSGDWRLGYQRYGFNMEKRNRKTVVLDGPKNTIPIEWKGKQYFQQRRKVVREAHWIAWIYKIPEFITNVAQGTRNVYIVP